MAGTTILAVGALSWKMRESGREQPPLFAEAVQAKARSGTQIKARERRMKPESQRSGGRSRAKNPIHGQDPAHGDGMKTEEFCEFARTEIEQTIPSRFEKQVARHAARIAIRTQSSSLTFEELNRTADRIAVGILDQLGDREEPVAILFEQSAEAVIAILAILKAGKIFLPIDPACPRPRLAAQLADSGCRLILTDERSVSQTERWTGHGISVLDMNQVSARSSGASARVELTPDRLACLFYTSGSTGDPKGVIDNHRNVLHNIMRYTNNLCITADDRLSLIQAPAFSGTVSSLFGALLNGASVCPFDVRKEGFEALAGWVNEIGITIYHSVPAIFRGLVSGERQFPAVRVVRLEGDQALPLDVDLHRRFFPEKSHLAIGLGATETGLSCQYLIDGDTIVDAGTVPVGYPTQDFSVSIRDETGADVGKLLPGEIAVHSRFLAVGYWRQERLQRSVFLPDPADKQSRMYLTGDRGRLRDDGCLEFLGRQDSQPRIRGQCVELGEVEAALLGVRGISQAVAAVRKDARGEPQLVAYLAGSPGNEPSLSVIREVLALELTDAMIPSRVVHLNSLPLSENGKLDRRKLPAPPSDRECVSKDSRPANDDTEIKLIGIWEDVLGQCPVGPNDNFFDLGGDSLKAALICAKIEQVFGKQIPEHSLNLSQTVADLAIELRNVIPVRRKETIVALQPRGSKPPLYFVHDHFGRISWYGPLAGRLGADQPCYGIQVSSDADLQPKITSLEDLASYYIGKIRSMQPSGPIHVAGLCFGGVVAFEMAQQLAARREPVGLVGLIGVSPHDFPGAVSPLPAFLWRRHAQVELLARQVRRIGGKIRGLADRRTRRDKRGEADPVPETAGFPAKSPVIAAHHSTLFRNYNWRPYPGPIELLLEGHMARLYTRHPVENWQKLSTHGVVVHLSPFRISRMFTEAHVATLAKQLRHSLDSYGECS